MSVAAVAAMTRAASFFVVGGGARQQGISALGCVARRYGRRGGDCRGTRTLRGRRAGRFPRRQRERGRRSLCLVRGEARARRGGCVLLQRRGRGHALLHRRLGLRTRTLFGFKGESDDFFVSGGRGHGIGPQQLHRRQHLCQLLMLVSLLAVALRRNIMDP